MTTRLDEIKKRMEQATPGPWKWRGGYDFLIDGDLHTVHSRRQCEDADFIAHAREDIPWLVAEVERLERERDLYLEALIQIENEPNVMGPNADNAIEDYGIKAWDIAHEALRRGAALDAAKEGK